MPQTNPKYTTYALNASGGAFTVIRLTTFAKYVEITEDPNANAGVQQGLQFNMLSPFAQSGNITHDAQPAPPDYGIVLAVADPPPATVQPQLAIGDKHNIHSGTQAPLGNPGSAGNVDNPGGVATLGTPLVQLRSNGADATVVVVKEWA